MSKLDLPTIPQRVGSNHPEPFAAPMSERIRQCLGNAGGLTQFGVNLLQLTPGSWSSQRHWHSLEDEFVFVVAGEVTLVTDEGEQILRPGDCAAFPSNRPNGHHLVNRSAAIAVCLEVGGRNADDVSTYSDIDMIFDPKMDAYVHKDGTPYPNK
jgi:uncharacterized cupin superfamily protein